MDEDIDVDWTVLGRDEGGQGLKRKWGGAVGEHCANFATLQPLNF